MSLPVDFEAKIKAPPASSGRGYPYAISAGDLMRNFVYAAGEFKEEEFEITDSKGEDSPHTTRKISLKNPFKGTAHGDVPFWNRELNDNAGGWQMAKPTEQGHFFYWNTQLNNNLGGWQMIAKPQNQGEILFWNKKANNDRGGWELVTVTEPGAFLAWDKNANGGLGGWVSVNPEEDGQMIYWSADAKAWQKVTPADNSIIFYKDKQWQPLTAPASGTHVLGAVDGALQWIATEEC
jgi:hypothetical protein